MLHKLVHNSMRDSYVWSDCLHHHPEMFLQFMVGLTMHTLFTDQAFQSHPWSNSVYVVFPCQKVPNVPLILYFHGVWLSPPFTMFHYLVRKFILVVKAIVVEQRRHWYKQLHMVHTYTCSFLFTYFECWHATQWRVAVQEVTYQACIRHVSDMYQTCIRQK